MRPVVDLGMRDGVPAALRRGRPERPEFLRGHQVTPGMQVQTCGCHATILSETGTGIGCIVTLMQNTAAFQGVKGS